MKLEADAVQMAEDEPVCAKELLSWLDPGGHSASDMESLFSCSTAALLQKRLRDLLASTSTCDKTE